MTLNEFIENLQKLQAQGHGDLQVFYRHDPSGDCGTLSTASVAKACMWQCGPYLLEEGEPFISIHAEN